MAPSNSRQNVLSLVDILLVRTGMARCELALRSGVFACCSNNPESLCYLNPTNPTRRLGETGCLPPWAEEPIA